MGSRPAIIKTGRAQPRNADPHP